LEEINMKFLKIFAVVMAVCLLGAAFVSCDTRRWNDDTVVIETQASGVEVTLVIKDGSKTEYEGKVVCNGKLGNAIELFCAGEFEEEIQVFDSTGLLSTIGELKAGDGKHWKAYYEDQGQEKAFESIKDQEVKAGKTIVVVLD
jgi:hypothetical protein